MELEDGDFRDVTNKEVFSFGWADHSAGVHVGLYTKADKWHETLRYLTLRVQNKVYGLLWQR